MLLMVVSPAPFKGAAEGRHELAGDLSTPGGHVQHGQPCRGLSECAPTDETKQPFQQWVNEAR